MTERNTVFPVCLSALCVLLFCFRPRDSLARLPCRVAYDQPMYVTLLCPDEQSIPSPFCIESNTHHQSTCGGSFKNKQTWLPLVWRPSAALQVSASEGALLGPSEEFA